MESRRNLVVVHYKNWKLFRGYTRDFLPTRDSFHLTSELDEEKGHVHTV